MWIYDKNINKIILKDLDFVPALYKIFDEILVNASDNKMRDDRTSFIKINIDARTNEISICNDGCGIPVILHSHEGIYIPSLIFGHLLTSSNYDDSVDKITGGRNGFGAKLCNLFSSKFVVETSSELSGCRFKQSWFDNMHRMTDPLIEDTDCADFTKISFTPDLHRFGMPCLDDGIISLFHRRAFDIASCLPNVKVYFNENLIPTHSFEDYVDLYIDKETNMVHHQQFNEHLSVAVTISPTDEFYQVSFVNGIHTRNGGQHVDHFTNHLTKSLMELVKNKFKEDSHFIRPSMIRNSLWVFMNSVIVNPTFESQSKEYLSMLPRDIESKYTISDKFVNEVAKCGLYEKIEAAINIRKKTQENKVLKSKSLRLDIPKLDDALLAGTESGHKCTLILTEGDSAKTLALSGLSVVGKSFYGIYPLRGKSLNVRDVTRTSMLKNAEFCNLIKIIGLQYGAKYSTEDSIRKLRYGKVMIMTDQDPDGSHIKGLILNYFHYNWPELLQNNFLQQFITPIIKAFKSGCSISFYSLSEFHNWQKSTSNYNTWRIKYYKGLGTSTSAEAKQYFSNIEDHRKKFHYSGPVDDTSLKMAFDPSQTENRKDWLLKSMANRTDGLEKDLIEETLYGKEIESISYSDFVNKELVLFSTLDNERSIPSIMDGLKPSQRKVLFTCFKRSQTKEIKVAQLAGSVAELSSYHHGEMSLYDTITGLAQDFVGSNNINLLMPIGQFGTRVFGGNDKASGRYIYTKLSPITKMIFHPEDDYLLTYLSDNNIQIEPKWYAPIIPMILVNGCHGIGTGWKSSVPNYNPLDIIHNLKMLISGQSLTPMKPWFRNFTGDIKEIAPKKYVSTGKIKQISQNRYEITELPIRYWTQSYKEDILNLIMTNKNTLIKKFEDHYTDADVKFIIQLNQGRLNIRRSTNLISYLKLQKYFSTEQMVLFDENGRIQRFDTAEEILIHFFHIRLEIYEKRKQYIEALLFAEFSKIENQLRFIRDNIDQTLNLRNIREDDLIDLLKRRNYLPDPVKKWQTSKDEIKNANDDEMMETNEYFNYLLSMPMKSLTSNNFQNLNVSYHKKRERLENIQLKSPKDLWLDDLRVLEDEIKILYKKDQ